MSVKLRLQRKGKRDAKTYRIVAIDESSKRNGREIEQLGFYNSNVKPAVLTIDKKKVELWLKKGAIPSLIVKKLIEL